MILDHCKNDKYTYIVYIIVKILSNVFENGNIFGEKTLWLHISGNATNAMFPCSCAVNVNILNKTIFASYSEHVKKTNTQRYGWWGRETANKNRQIDKGVPRGFHRKKPLNDAAILL